MSVTAQTVYWLNPSTGQREILSLVITPLGTEAAYRNDYSVIEYKPIDIKGNPMKAKRLKAVLPTQETVMMVFPTEKEPTKLIYNNGEIRVFKEAALYSNKKDKQIAYFAVHVYYENEELKYKVFYKSWEDKNEKELVLLEKKDEANGLSYYKLIMPDNTFATLQEYVDKETFLTNAYLIDMNDKKIFFTKEQ
jgi:hypothetical protein